jgi:hypothetical protein
MALEVQPNCVEYKIGKACCLYESGRYEESILELKDAGD